MTSFRVTREINASTARIWGILTDPVQLATPAFGIIAITGNIHPGGRIRLTSDVDPNRAFSLQVTHFDAERGMVWSSGMPLGLFKGTREFSLDPTASGTTFIMEETFSGALSALVTSSMPDLRPSFEKFATALKQGAEA